MYRTPALCTNTQHAVKLSTLPGNASNTYSSKQVEDKVPQHTRSITHTKRQASKHCLPTRCSTAVSSDLSCLPAACLAMLLPVLACHPDFRATPPRVPTNAVVRLHAPSIAVAMRRVLGVMFLSGLSCEFLPASPQLCVCPAVCCRAAQQPGSQMGLRA